MPRLMLEVGECYETSFGEVFGPMQRSPKDHLQPFMCRKGDRIDHFGKLGHYANDGRPHMLDLVRVHK